MKRIEAKRIDFARVDGAEETHDFYISNTLQQSLHICLSCPTLIFNEVIVDYTLCVCVCVCVLMCLKLMKHIRSCVLRSMHILHFDGNAIRRTKSRK